MPCEPKPVAYWIEKGASGRVVTMSGEVVACTFEGDHLKMSWYGFIPHWANCPGAEQGRR